jgi:hypothetical protein
MFPVDVSPVIVPTLVIFGCAAVVSVPVSNDAPTVPLFAYTLPAITFPDEFTLVSVPTLVILGCAAVVTVPAVVAEVAVVAAVALATVPTILAAAMLVRPAPLPVNIPVFAVKFTAVIVPLTSNDVSVPSEVTFGCAAVVSVPVSLVAETLLAETFPIIARPLLLNIARFARPPIPIVTLPPNAPAATFEEPFEICATAPAFNPVMRAPFPMM